MAWSFWDTSGDEPVYASRLNNGAMWTVTSIAEMKATDVTDLPTNAKFLLTPQSGDIGAVVYHYNKTATDTADDFNIVEPTTGGGRFFRQPMGGDFKKFTTATTWSAISGLSTDVVAEHHVNATALTGGLVAVIADDIVVDSVMYAEIEDLLVLSFSITGAGAYFNVPQSQKLLNLAYFSPKRLSAVSSYLTIVTSPSIREVSGATGLNSSGSFASAVASVWGLSVENGGQYAFLLDNADDILHRHTMSTPGQPSTMSTTPDSGQELNVGTITGTSNIQGIKFKPDGLKFYALDGTADKIFEISLASAFDLTSATALLNTFSFNPSVETAPAGGFDIDDSGKYLALVGSSTVKLCKLTTPWSLGAVTYSGTEDMSAGITDVAFGPYGKSMLATDADSPTDYLRSYQYTKGFDLSSGFNETDSLDISTSGPTESAPRGCSLSVISGAVYIYFVGTSADKLHRYTITQAYAGTVLAKVSYGVSQ